MKKLRNLTLLATLLVLTSLAGCAKLPMENEPPSAPVLTSDGIVGPFGVEISVLVDDPDGDMVTLQIQATPASGVPQTFSWTSFFASGQEEVFLLNLNPVGSWVLTATARDEIDEESASSTTNLTVALPRP